MATRTPEIIVPGQSLPSQERYEQRQDSFGSSPILTPVGGLLPATQLNDNYALLAPPGPQGQVHARGILTTPRYRLSGHPGARMNGLTVRESVFIDNVIFNFGHAVLVEATGTGAAIFRGCTFEDEVTMVVGPRAIFIGSYFTRSGRVNNAGAAGDAGIVGCRRDSGIAHVAVTTVFEI